MFSAGSSSHCRSTSRLRSSPVSWPSAWPPGDSSPRMCSTAVVVRTALPIEADQVAVPLAESHFDDPGMVAFFPRPDVRPRALRLVFGLTVRDAIHYGHVYVAVMDGRVIGSAVWLPPGTFPPTGPRKLAALPGLARLFATAPSRFGTFTRFGMAAAARADKSAWFLAGLGVAPAHQGGGVGTRLLRRMLDEADFRREPCLLNTQNHANIRYYGRHGFDIVDGPWRADSGPATWTLRRVPSPQHRPT
ncbi:GNAT family N-acetyltransferase [Nocardia sp. NPDC052566]|uniref:GNAT family N-acetyltransferase n=1 Tax=Nocardia sp. NPDC052566 TaxID=3364330 RepID=UPI0037C6AA5D